MTYFAGFTSASSLTLFSPAKSAVTVAKRKQERPTAEDNVDDDDDDLDVMLKNLADLKKPSGGTYGRNNNHPSQGRPLLNIHCVFRTELQSP